MMESLQALVKQPYWVIALILGAALVAIPCVTIDKDYHWQTHPPNSHILVWIGVSLLLLSTIGFWFATLSQRTKQGDLGADLDLTRVKGRDGTFWTTVAGCEIRVITGRIENQGANEGSVVSLPCNEYFDDRCAGDTRSALGAYVNRAFEGQVEELVALVKEECKKQLGPGTEQQKTNDERAESFGAGRCVLLARPLNRSIPIALLSTTTQRAGQGLSARISYLFDALRELVSRLADARLNEVAMPMLGAGHGGIDPPLAFVGLLLAVAETARYSQGRHHLRRVTIVVFKSGPDKPPEVAEVIIRRALALIGSRD